MNEELEAQVRQLSSSKFGFLRAESATLFPMPEKERRLLWRREATLTSEDLFYHYTTLSGFQGIVESGGFWASDNRFLNDELEMRDGANLVARALIHRAERTSVPGFGAMLSTIVETFTTTPKSGRLVACFSKARDSLEQWRAYGSKGGVCIQLASKSEEGERTLIIGPEQLLFRAVYGTREKLNMIFSIIRRYEREYAKDRDHWGENWPSEHDIDFASSLRSKLAYSIVGFKDGAFIHEEEVRMVLPPSGYIGGLRFRATEFGLIPFVCTADHRAMGNTGLLPIREVIIGPHPRQQLIAESVESFLEHHGYDRARVTLSKVPYRS